MHRSILCRGRAASGREETQAMYVALLFASAAIFIVVATIYARKPFASVFHPITFYLIFHGFVFVVRPFFAYAQGYHIIYTSFLFTPSPEAKAAAIVVANIGLLAFVAGAWRTGATVLPFRQQRADLDQRQRLIVPFMVVAAMLAPIAILSLIDVYGGGWSSMRVDRSVGITVNTTANGWFIEAQLLLVPLCVLFAWATRFRWWSLLPLITFVLIRGGTGGRGPFIVACVAAGLLWLYDSKRRWPPASSLGLLAGLVLLFYIVGQDRGASVRAFVSDGAVVAVEEQQGFMESMDFANLEFLEFLTETIPRKTGTHGWFLDNLQVLTEPIPRKFWPGKPVGQPIKLYNLFEFGRPFGMTYSLPGNGWAQGGYFGVGLWCGLWGMALGAIYSRFARGLQGNFAVALYFSFLPIFVIAFRDGQLLTIVRTAVFYLSPILLWALVARAMGVQETLRRLVINPRRTPPRIALSRRTPPGEPLPPPRSRRAAPDGGIVPRAWRVPPRIQAPD